MKTKDNLQSAIAGESQANRKYLAFSDKAAKEGFNKVSRLFKVVADAETIHAHPTLSEAIMEAAEDCFGLSTHKI